APHATRSERPRHPRQRSGANARLAQRCRDREVRLNGRADSALPVCQAGSPVVANTALWTPLERRKIVNSSNSWKKLATQGVVGIVALAIVLPGIAGALDDDAKKKVLDYYRRKA